MDYFYRYVRVTCSIMFHCTCSVLLWLGRVLFVRKMLGWVVKEVSQAELGRNYSALARATFIFFCETNQSSKWNWPSWYRWSRSTTVQCGLCTAWLHWTNWSQTWATVVRPSTARLCELWSSLWNTNRTCRTGKPSISCCQQFIANSKYKIKALFKDFSRTQIAFFKHQNYQQKATS